MTVIITEDLGVVAMRNTLNTLEFRYRETKIARGKSQFEVDCDRDTAEVVVELAKS